MFFWRVAILTNLSLDRKNLPSTHTSCLGDIEQLTEQIYTFRPYYDSSALYASETEAYSKLLSKIPMCEATPMTIKNHKKIVVSIRKL